MSDQGRGNCAPTTGIDAIVGIGLPNPRRFGNQALINLGSDNKVTIKIKNQGVNRIAVASLIFLAIQI